MSAIHFDSQTLVWSIAVGIYAYFRWRSGGSRRKAALVAAVLAASVSLVLFPLPHSWAILGLYLTAFAFAVVVVGLQKAGILKTAPRTEPVEPSHDDAWRFYGPMDLLFAAVTVIILVAIKAPLIGIPIALFVLPLVGFALYHKRRMNRILTGKTEL